MATTAAQIIADARILLKDAGSDTWPDATLLKWVSAGQREIAAIRLDAYPRFSVVTTAAGTRQAIPSDGSVLLNVVRNMGSDGATPGRAIKKMHRDELDRVRPEWHTDTAAAATNYVYDTTTPLVFYLYPPAASGAKVEISYAAVPAELSATSDNIVLNDSYRNALTDYVLYRAFAEDSDIPSAAARATAFRQAFDSFLGAKSSAEGAAATAVANA